MTAIQDPIFIGGCERSGTTLLGAMLGAHSDLITTPESQFLGPAFKTDLSPEEVLRKMTGNWRFKLWGLQPRERISVPKDRATLVRKLVAAYGTRAGAPSTSRWVDHTPTNFQRTRGLIDLFPDAKFIHIVRDGRAVASSVMKLDWGPNTIIRAARWWLESAAHGLAAETILGLNQVMRVHYEDLVTDPRPVLTRLSAFLGIEYQPEMALARGFRPPGYTADQHRFIGRPPNPSRIEAWRNELTPRQIEIFEYITGDFLPLMGYTLDFDGNSSPYTSSERFRQGFSELFRSSRNRVRFGIRRRTQPRDR